MATKDKQPRRIWRWILGVPAGLLLLLAFAVLSVIPEVPEQARPTAQDIQAAREGYRALRARRANEFGGSVRFDQRTLAGLTALARDASNIDRLRLELDEDGLSGQASVPLPLGLWVNLEGHTRGSAEGFPPYSCRAGWVSPPDFMCRWSAEMARRILIWRGAALPPLDELVRYLKLDGQTVFLSLYLPANSDLIDNLVTARGERIVEQDVTEYVCKLAKWQGAEQRTLAQTLQYLYSDNQGVNPDRNRTRLIALALHVVGGQAKPVAPGAYEASRPCATGAARVSLLGRNDLAKHWAYSAGLTARFGEDTASDLGEWKELRDSLGGSGFSFVDIAADRSGVAYANSATRSGSAQRTARRLARVSDAQLLPAHLLSAPEGLAEEQFTDQFGALDAKAYRRAVGYIDRELASGR